MDRNYKGAMVRVYVWESLSARRAWIEMSIKSRSRAQSFVALRKESVDRNKEATP